LAKCKLHPIQNFRAPKLLQYSFGDICRPFQPSHLKNHEFHFFTNFPTKPSTYVVVHRQPWPCAKPSKVKTFVHQEFNGIHLGTFVGLSNPPRISFFHKTPPKPYGNATMHRPNWPCAKPFQFKTFVHQDFYSTLLGTFVDLSNAHISKITNFIFSQNSPPSHIVVSWCTANFGHVQNPPNSKLSCTKNFMVFIWGHL